MVQVFDESRATFTHLPRKILYYYVRVSPCNFAGRAHTCGLFYANDGLKGWNYLVRTL